METSDTLFFEAGQEVSAKFEQQRSTVTYDGAEPSQADQSATPNSMTDHRAIARRPTP